MFFSLRRPAILGLAAVLAVPVMAQRPRVARPFFQLRLENAKVFTDSDYAPLFEGLGGLLAEQFGIEGEEPRAELDALWGRLRWPIDVVAIIERRSRLPLVGIWMPAETRPLLGSLVALTSGDAGATTDVKYEEAVFQMTTLQLPDDSGRLLMYEGVRGQRRLLLLGPGSVGLDPAEALGLYVRSAERTTPSRHALEQEARGGDIGWVFNYRSLIGSFSDDHVGLAKQLLGFALGPRFTGMSGRMRVDDGKIAIDLYTDIVPGGGYVGAILHREPRELVLAGWIPEDASDYLALDPSVDGCVRLLRNLGFLGQANAADMHHNLAWLGDTHVGNYLDTHFTGQVIAATEVGIETQFADIENVKGFALGFGSFDGVRLLEDTRQRVHGSVEPNGDKVELVKTPEKGPGVHTLSRGRKPFVYMAANKDVVFVAGADPAGAAMLRKCMATGGRSRQPLPLRGPARASPDRVCTMLGRGHVVRHLTAALEDIRGIGNEERGLPEILRDFLAEHGGVATWRLVVSRDGARLHVEL